MSASSLSRAKKTDRLLPRLMMLLLCLQPLLDIVSYWQDRLAIPISLSFLPRAVVFAVLFLGGLILSDSKKVYWAMLGTILVFWGVHLAVCLQNGMTVPTMIDDTVYFISVLQLPITAVSMITCLKRTGEDGFDALLQGVFWSMAILMLSFVVSNLTGTEPHTYPDREVGICGYCFWPNAQSAILSVCAPVCIAYILRKKPENTLLCVITILLCLTVLYLHGTRLSYLCMLLTGIGMAIVFLLTGQKRRYVIAVLSVTAVLTALFYISPMFTNRSFVAQYTEQKADASERLIELGQIQLRSGYSQILTDEGVSEPKTGMQAFALTEVLEESTFTDMERFDVEAKLAEIRNPDLRRKNAMETAYARLRAEVSLRLIPYQEKIKDAYREYVGYVQTLELVTSADKLYNYYPFATVHVVDLLASADRVYERYTGTQELSGWENAGDNWHDIFIERSKLYGYDGVTLYQDNPWSECSRAQAAEILCRALPLSEYPQIRDMDSVPGMEEDAPYYDAVLTLFRAGVLVDCPDGEDFRPTEKINRLTYAAWLAAAVNPAFRICDEGFTVSLPEKLPTVDPASLDPAVRSDAELFPLYDYFLYDMTDRFGIRKVAEQYERSTAPEKIIDERVWKLQFCYLLMDESTPLSRLFGLEADRMVHKGYSNDVENDIHAIYFRFGWVGIALMAAFLLYFVFLIVRALIRKPKQIFTLEAGAIGIALLAVMAHACYTCGVLRRANTLYYFGVLLAGAYYLVKIKVYPDTEKGLPDDERTE